MQDCFRSHPDIYGSELDDDDQDPPPDNQDAPTSAFTPAPLADDPIPPSATSSSPSPSPSPHLSTTAEQNTSDTERALAAKQQVEHEHGQPMGSEGDEQLVPKAAHDATGATAVSGK